MVELVRSLTRHPTLAGLWIAGIGFFVTRFTVTLAAFDDRAQFIVAGIVPLVLGLLLAVFGIALVVGRFDPGFIRTIAVWCTAGVIAMFVLATLTVIGSAPGTFGANGSIRSKIYLGNFLVGGGIGGALTGVYAAQNRSHREDLEQQANRLVMLNRFLRHEVLNSATVIRGTIDTLGANEEPSIERERVDLMKDRIDHIVDAIENVKHLTETTHAAEPGLYEVDLREYLEASVELARTRFPDAEYRLSVERAEGVTVWANSQLKHVFLNLIENAAKHNDADWPLIEIDVEVTGNAACVRIADNGPGLPERQRRTLEEGDIAEFDDTTAGFGLNIVRLFVERYSGEIDTSVTEAGSTIEIELSRAESRPPPMTDLADVRTYGIEKPKLVGAVGAALLAGAAMGALMQAAAGVIPVIGALYGVSDPLVGWITHEFHSVVFGLIYAGLLVVAPADRATELRGRLLIGAGWGIFLWLFAAGVVMPAWLRLLGMTAPVPNLRPVSLVAHLLWGLSLGALYRPERGWTADVRTLVPGVGS